MWRSKKCDDKIKNGPKQGATRYLEGFKYQRLALCKLGGQMNKVKNLKNTTSYPTHDKYLFLLFSSKSFFINKNAKRTAWHWWKDKETLFSWLILFEYFKMHSDNFWTSHILNMQRPPIYFTELQFPLRLLTQLQLHVLYTMSHCFFVKCDIEKIWLNLIGDRC